MGSVVALAGQVGGAKLADGFYRLRGESLTVVVNTGDDYEHLGLAFSPDIDTMLYTLAGIASPSAGWEPEGETHAVHAMLRSLAGRAAPACRRPGERSPPHRDHARLLPQPSDRRARAADDRRPRAHQCAH